MTIELVHFVVSLKAYFAETPLEQQTKIMLARRVMIQDGLTLEQCFALHVRLAKAALLDRLGAHLRQ